MVVIAFGLYKFLPKRQRESLLGIHWDHSHRLNARMLSAAALLLKRAVLEDVGGFDERFHMYGEDNEFALRVVRSGWLMLFEPKATVTHHAGKSTAQRWGEMEKLTKKYEGFFRLQRIHLSRRAAVANLVTGYGLATLRHLWLTLRGRPVEENRLVRSLYGGELRQMLSGARPGVGRGDGQ
jgi:GT2 family glycosyltransferase